MVFVSLVGACVLCVCCSFVCCVLRVLVLCLLLIACYLLVYWSFCVLSVVGLVFVVGWLVVYCVCVWGDFCVVLLVFLFLFCGVAQVVFAFWVCVFGVCFGVAGWCGVFWGVGCRSF